MSITGITTSAVKKINRSKVYALIYSEKTISKQAISQKLHMSLTTVSQNIKDLEEMNLIKKDGLYESTGGRKAQMINIINTARISIGVNILKKMVYITAVDLYGNILEKSTINMPFKNSPSYCSELGEKINTFINSLQYHKDAVLGVAIAIQGVISQDGKVITYGKIMNCTGAKLENFAQFIKYPCRLEHDSKAAAYSELWHKKNVKDAFVLLLNHNLGGALIMNGKIHQGREMHSGTIEHMCIVPNGKLCYCGKKGCLEAYCSADSLSDAAKENLDDFFKNLRKNEPNRKKIWETYLNNLAFAIKNINMVIDCNIVISGFLAPYMTKDDIDILYNMVKKQSPFIIDKNLIRINKYSDFTTAAGAALYYIDAFLQRI